MAGFAVSLDYLENSPNATMPFTAGYEEDEFLKSIGLKIEEIEPKASNCTEILVWHTQTKKAKVPVLQISRKTLNSDNTSLAPILKELEAMGAMKLSPGTGENCPSPKSVSGNVHSLQLFSMLSSVFLPHPQQVSSHK